MIEMCNWIFIISVGRLATAHSQRANRVVFVVINIPPKLKILTIDTDKKT